MAQYDYGSKSAVQPDPYGGNKFPPGYGPSPTATLRQENPPSTHSRFSCPECGKVITGPGMPGHRRTHMPKKRYICSVCSKELKDSWKLAKHERMHVHDTS